MPCENAIVAFATGKIPSTTMIFYRSKTKTLQLKTS